MINLSQTGFVFLQFLLSDDDLTPSYIMHHAHIIVLFDAMRKGHSSSGQFIIGSCLVDDYLLVHRPSQQSCNFIAKPALLLTNPSVFQSGETQRGSEPN